jgi:hypothetical protein
LRVVLVVPESVEAWAAAAAKHIANGTATRIVGLVSASDEPRAQPSGQNAFPWWLRLFGAPRSARPVRVLWSGPRTSINRAPDLVSELGADAAVWLGSGVLDPRLARRLSEVVRHGILSVRIGGRAVNAMSGVEEVVAGRPLTVAELVGTDGTGAVTVLRSGRYRTILGSLNRNRDVVLDAVATWPELELRAVGLGHGPSGEERPITPGPSVRRAGLVALLVIAGQAVRKRLRALLRHDEWNVGLIRGACPESILRGQLPAAWLPPRRGRYAADPFLARDGKLMQLVVEDYRYRSGRGGISRIEIGADGSVGPARPVLRCDSHLSYPFVLETAEGVVMIPESGAAGRVDMYRPSAFPDDWRRTGTLLDLPASDSTVLWYGDRYWLFATLPGPREDAELWLWHALQLEGPWTAHPRNPVKVDVRSSRPGGTPFRWNGAVYRPAQDSSRRYGGRLAINRIDVLSETDFREITVAVLEPDPSGPYPDGLHTLSIADDLAVVDGLRTTFSLAEFARAIRRNVPIGAGRR